MWLNCAKTGLGVHPESLLFGALSCLLNYDLHHWRLLAQVRLSFLCFATQFNVSLFFVLPFINNVPNGLSLSVLNYDLHPFHLRLLAHFGLFYLLYFLVRLIARAQFRFFFLLFSTNSMFLYGLWGIAYLLVSLDCDLAPFRLRLAYPTSCVLSLSLLRTGGGGTRPKKKWPSRAAKPLRTLPRPYR